MNEAWIMQVVNWFCDLIDDILFVFLLKISGFSIFSDESMEIDIHMFEEQVDIFVVSGSNGLLKANDVVMFELPQEHNFSVGPLCICGIGEGIKVLL